MNGLIVESTSEALWQSAIEAACRESGQRLDESLEAYLLFLLLRFSRRPELLRTLMAKEYLEGLQLGGRLRDERLRDVGDQCLLLAGLFPGMAARRRVTPTYFVDLGRTAYGELAARLKRSLAALYRDLALGFVALMDVLHALRGSAALEALSPLEQWALWSHAGSRSAHRALLEGKQATLIRNEAPGLH